MQHHSSMRRLLLIVGVAALSSAVLLGILPLYLHGQVISYTKNDATSNNSFVQDPLDGWSIMYIHPGVQAEPEQTGPGLPARLRIPKIGVDAPVEYVGLALDGAMDTPSNLDDVAWLKLGQRPGEIGNAVFAGHYGRKNGKASVFDNLYKLRKGDRLYIEDDKGVSVSFGVQGSLRYGASENAADVFGSSDGKAHLNLITCEGVWNPVSKSYPKRLVVFADKE